MLVHLGYAPLVLAARIDRGLSRKNLLTSNLTH
jgi:hypothetical protein